MGVGEGEVGGVVEENVALAEEILSA